jgi:hypothetical protein
MPQRDGQDERAPRHLDRIVVASFATRSAQRLQKGMIGDGFQKKANGFERRRIFESVPSEQGKRLWLG